MSRSGRVVYSAVLPTCVMGSSPKPPPMLMDVVCWYVDQKGYAAMLTSIQSAGVTQEANQRHSMQARKPTREKSTLTLKPRTYQWPHKKDFSPPKNLKNYGGGGGIVLRGILSPDLSCVLHTQLLGTIYLFIFQGKHLKNIEKNIADDSESVCIQYHIQASLNRINLALICLKVMHLTRLELFFY